MSFLLKHARALLVAMVLLAPCIGAAEDVVPSHAPEDLIALPIERLLETDFAPASRIARQVSDAPSAVSIVTAQDIHDYGYRTLADILKSMRGLFVTSSLQYDYLGGRGFGEPGDYASRILLLIDGYATGDGVFNQVYLGQDGLLDVAMIDRVEYVSGPGSVTYGNSAFLGIINIVTKQGKDFDGTRVAVGLGDHSAKQTRLTYGKQLENGADILLSASLYGDDGRSVRFPALDNVSTLSGEPFTNQTFDHFEENSNRRLFFKGHFENWTLELAHVRRLQANDAFFSGTSGLTPSLIGGQAHYIDDNSFASLKYDTELGANLKSSTHLYYGQYLSRIDYFDDLFVPVQQTAGSRWWGADFKFVGSWFDRHKIVFGGEYRDDYQQRFSDNSVAFVSGGFSGFDTSMRTISLYVQDEFSITDRLRINPGVRYDHNSVSGSNVSPRIALIYTPWDDTTFKLSHGKSFRYNNAWYRMFVPDFPSEGVTTTELVWQQQLGRTTRLTASVYNNDLVHAIGFAHNYRALNTVGQEIGIEHLWDNGARLNASITHQDTTDNAGNWFVNSPQILGKLNVSQPLFQRRLNLGVEVQAMGRHLAEDGSIVQANSITNLTISSNKLIDNTDVSLSIRNLFDQKIEDVSESTDLRTLQQDGRNLWLQMEYDFK